MILVEMKVETCHCYDIVVRRSQMEKIFSGTFKFYYNKYNMVTILNLIRNLWEKDLGILLETD